MDTEIETGRRPDAVVWPDGYFGRGAGLGERLADIKTFFGKVLGVEPGTEIHTHPACGGHAGHFTHPLRPGESIAGQTLLFGKMHPRAGEPRYRWYPATYDRPSKSWSVASTAARDHNDLPAGGVLFGFKVPGADEPGVGGILDD